MKRIYIQLRKELDEETQDYIFESLSTIAKALNPGCVCESYRDTSTWFGYGYDGTIKDMDMFNIGNEIAIASIYDEIYTLDSYDYMNVLGHFRRMGAIRAIDPSLIFTQDGWEKAWNQLFPNQDPCVAPCKVAR